LASTSNGQVLLCELDHENNFEVTKYESHDGHVATRVVSANNRQPGLFYE